MEYNSITDITNMYAECNPAIYKDFHIITDFLKKLTTNKKKLVDFLSH